MTDPLERLGALIEQARDRGAPDPEAMALATATRQAVPSVRVVLCRGVDARGLRFFTNYASRKGTELEANPHAAAVFFWPALRAQVRVEGTVERLAPAESDEYFDRRPHGHRIAALVSPQSQPIENVQTLRARARDLAAEYGGRPVPRPAHWGGYLLRPSAVEFWTEGADRIHERIRMDRGPGGWKATPLAP